MQKRAPFLNKLLKHFERLDQKSVQTYLTDVTGENNLLYQILEQVGEGVLLVSPKGKLFYANRQAELWLGLPEGGAGKAKLTDLIADSDLSQFIQAGLENLQERLVGDIQILVPRERTLRVILAPIQNSEAENPVLILLSDISQIQASVDENQIRTKALTSLAAGIAHEIGNPLNSLMIHLELLKKDMKSLPEAKQKSLEKTLNVLNGETARLDRIIRNFLKATRRPPLRFKEEDLNRIVEDAVSFLAPAFKENKVAIHFQPDPNLPHFLMDAERLHQAFLNLLKNGMEAMPRGGGLSIAISHKDSVVSVSVRDQGKGIPKDDLPHIFEAYYTTKEEGSGLGLMTVYNVVREHGGRIDVTSKPGKGTMFMLHLPIRQPKFQIGYRK